MRYSAVPRMSVMGAATFGVEAFLADLFASSGVVDRLIRVAGAILAGLAALAVSAWALGIREFQAAMARVLGRSTRPLSPQ